MMHPQGFTPSVSALNANQKAKVAVPLAAYDEPRAVVPSPKACGTARQSKGHVQRRSADPGWIKACAEKGSGRMLVIDHVEKPSTSEKLEWHTHSVEAVHFMKLLS